ncbi:hypothetical protein SMD11_1214 [Streptomyces albireticuli]|uniref:Uncharacterized protein n=1 Tax=Streptomyces albireticuli TaxID=1940 RepID=A0A1Z2KXU3_9ACTN|nr:hypothetical protein [Streptomyces albireticuli]ARZ66875.1 hypothetical protein SMD11_1214 [Streptomyces albireticuli]
MNGTTSTAEYKVDRAGNVGAVKRHDDGTLWMRPPQGGVEWHVEAGELRDPTPRELHRARVLGSPVGTVQP